MKDKTIIEELNEMEDKLSEITVDDDVVFPDFDEDYDREIRARDIKIDRLNKKIRIMDFVIGVSCFIIIPCLLGLLVNDTFKGCEIKQTAVAVIK